MTTVERRKMGTELMEREPEVVEAAPDLENMTLEELGAGANREYEKGLRSAAAAVEHWIAAGEYLLHLRQAYLSAREDVRDAEGSISRMEMKNHMEGVFAGSWYTARQCMRLATYQDVIRSAGIEDLPGALRAVIGLPAMKSDQGLYAPSVKAQAVEMVRAGTPMREVSRLIGVSYPSVRRWANPDEYERDKARKVERERLARQARRDEERRQAEHRRTDRITRRKDAVGDLYSLIRKATQLCDQGKSEVQDREGKLALAEAEALLHRADAAIVKALGLK